MSAILYQFDQTTVELVLKGLGKLPYEDVANTIDSIASHARATLTRQAEAAPAPAQREPVQPPPRRLRKKS